MAWQLQFDPAAVKELEKLDRPVQRRILKFLQERVALHSTPRSLGKPLQGKEFSGLIRFRVGDHRVIAQIQDELLVVLVLRIGHRSDVYQ